MILVSTAANDNFTSDDNNFDSNFPVNIANTSKYKDIYNNFTNGVFIDPSTDIIPLGKNITYSCYLYSSGVKTANTFVFTFSNLSEIYYQKNIIDGNHFSVKNLKSNPNKKLNIKCTSGTYVKNITIGMGGIF